MERQLKVSAIKNGTVLDHIPANQLFKVVDILKLSGCEKQMTIGVNLESKLLGKKAIIKLADIFLKDSDINKIALIAPHAKINIIHNFEVVEKRALTTPLQIEGIVKCMNPMCITNHQAVKTIFTTLNNESDGIQLLCHYCEKVTDGNNMKIISTE